MAVNKARIQLTLELEGKGRYPVVQFGSDWALNSIPSASCLLAVGRKMSDGTTVSEAHQGIWTANRNDRARVYFQADGDYDEFNTWPAKELLIFEGNVEGLGLQMMLGKLFLSVRLIHWLGHLDNASALNSSSHPGNPIQLSFSTLVNQSIITGVSKPRGMASLAVAAHFATNWGVVGKNLWGDGFKAMFCKLLSEKTVSFSTALAACVSNIRDPVQQPEMFDALTRIAGVSEETPDCNLTLPAYAPPLRLNDGGGLPATVVQALGNAVGQEMVESFASQTMWGKLLNYGSEFMFSVVPQVSRALVVPFLPLTRGIYCKTLEANDTDVKQLSSRLTKRLRAVAVYSPLSSMTGIESVLGSPETFGIGGCFAPATGADPKGLIWTVPAPRWLANLRVDGLSPTASSSLKARKLGSATTPGAYDPTLRGRPDSDKDTVFKTTAQLFSAYARTVYVNDVLRGRSGQIGGKLRFDIAPGSMVQIKSSGEPFVIADELHDTLVGAVTAVSIGINAENSAAGTSFRVEYFRTEKENTEDATSVDTHPLYLDKYLGAPLLDELQFGACDA